MHLQQRKNSWTPEEQEIINICFELKPSVIRDLFLPHRSASAIGIKKTRYLKALAFGTLQKLNDVEYFPGQIQLLQDAVKSECLWLLEQGSYPKTVIEMARLLIDDAILNKPERWWKSRENWPLGRWLTTHFAIDYRWVGV